MNLFLDLIVGCIWHRGTVHGRLGTLVLWSLTFLPHLAQSQTTQADTSKLHIWHPSRSYTYRAVLMEGNGDTLSDALVRIHPTGKTWDRDPQQTLADFEIDFTAVDSARLAPNPAHGKHYTWSRHYPEGVIENATRVWMHPIRSNQYVLTEIAPFPEIKLPIVEERMWKSTLYIYEAMGTFEGTVDCRYAIMGTDERTYAFGKARCWEVIAMGTHGDLGANNAIFYFSEEYGFTEMSYSFYNGKRLEIVLQGLEVR